MFERIQINVFLSFFPFVLFFWCSLFNCVLMFPFNAPFWCPLFICVLLFPFEVPFLFAFWCSLWCPFLVAFVRPVDRHCHPTSWRLPSQPTLSESCTEHNSVKMFIDILLNLYISNALSLRWYPLLVWRSLFWLIFFSISLYSCDYWLLERFWSLYKIQLDIIIESCVSD